MQNWFPACQLCLSMPLYLQPLLFQSENCIAKQLASQLRISSSSNFVQRQVYIDKNFISGVSTKFIAASSHKWLPHSW